MEVLIEGPRERRGYWMCSYKIGWPEGAKVAEARGADGVQALYLAMEAIALNLYGSEYHRSGELYWQKPGKGYGFPMPKPARDDLIGDDRELQV
ncbi:hypothetical protein [Devosia sp.]|uniref:DUF6968 family protein n=1 Tax=Devosia sp. TaxID=1871048 RepID=UPI002615AC1B|nr:hypothetical protein [Devosia sp.]